MFWLLQTHVIGSSALLRWIPIQLLRMLIIFSLLLFLRNESNNFGTGMIITSEDWFMMIFSHLFRFCRIVIPSNLFFLLLQVLCQLCDRPCVCPNPVPQCPTGVPLVLDGCRCCQVCARQLGESCTEMVPCDNLRGLQCDYSASFPGLPGECVSECHF